MVKDRRARDFLRPAALYKGPTCRPIELNVAPENTLASRTAVLVAEDRVPIRNLLAHTLEKGNFDVLTADNGAKALELYYKERPDVLVVLDVYMPILDGLTVLRKVLSRDTTRQS